MARLGQLLALVALMALAGACTPETDQRAASGDDPTRSVTVTQLVFLTRDGCSNTDRMRANLDEALASLGQPIAYEMLSLESLSESDVRIGYPTPTLLLDGRDLFGMPEPTPPLPGPT